MTIFTSQPTHITFDVEEYGAVELRYDTPVNPILAAFRSPDNDDPIVANWLMFLDRQAGILGATPSQIEHARRVLTRLESINRQEV